MGVEDVPAQAALGAARETWRQARGSKAPMRTDARWLGVMVGLFACTTASSTSTDNDGSTRGTTGAATGTGAMSTSSGALTTAATTGSAAAEEIVVCDFDGDDVRRYDAATGELLGTWTRAPELDGALGIVVGPDGHVYVASEEYNAVLQFDGATGEFIKVFVGDDPLTPDDETGGLKGPGALLFAADGSLLVSSFDGDAILRYDGATGSFDAVFVEAEAGGLNGPDAGMVFGPDGDLYVPSYYSDEVLRYDGVTGEPLGAFTPADGSLSRPRTLLFVGAHLLVTSEGSGEVVRFDAGTGAFVDVLVGPASAAPFDNLKSPSGMAQLADGTLLVVSLGGKTIEAFAVDSGAHLGTRVGAAGGLKTPTHMIVRARG